MQKAFASARVTLWANRIVALGFTILLFCLPAILSWYGNLRGLLPAERLAILIGFYCCAVAVLLAFWNMERLLGNILRREIFTENSVRRIRAIKWCCCAVTLICIPVTLIYYPLVFLTVVMGFLFLVVSVVARVMDAAVALREENDLTI